MHHQHFDTSEFPTVEQRAVAVIDGLNGLNRATRSEGSWRGESYILTLGRIRALSLKSLKKEDTGDSSST
jgi:hypothetical protein